MISARWTCGRSRASSRIWAGSARGSTTSPRRTSTPSTSASPANRASSSASCGWRLPPDPPYDGSPDWFRGPGLRPSESELLELERESQYGAWLLLFGREVNHFTASVPDVALWQRRMSEAGIPMKDEIEGAPGAGLRQTATRAAPREVQLRERKRDWPDAYLEIAERNGGFDGFVTAQARQLFDITRR